MNQTQSLFTALLLTGLSSVIGPAKSEAHPISLSASIVNVRQDRVDVEVTIMLEDLVLYQRLKAMNDNRYSARDLSEAAGKHGDFVKKYLVIRNSEGLPLRGKVVRTDKSQIDAKGVPATDVMAKSVVYHLEYPLKSRPAYLTLRQTFGGESAVLPAVMDCMVLQDGVLLDPGKQLAAGKPQTFRFDWENPPRPVRSWKELKEQREQDRRRRLGINSYGGLYSFIYIVDREVRHEILVPLLTFDKWMPVPRQRPDWLTVAEQQSARKKIAEFFHRQAIIEINGRPARCKLARLNFFGLDIRDFARNAKPRDVSVYQARLGIILSYPSPQALKRVEIPWQRFDRHATFLQSVVLVDNQPPQAFTFTKQNDRFRWQATPAKANTPRSITGVKASGLPKTDDQARAVAGALLTNVYTAFQERDEGETYDALSSSVGGELLRTLYLQVRRSLRMEEQGGARARVSDVKLLSCRLLANAAGGQFRCQCRWQVTGTVEHWGHVHTRQNEYDARLTIAAQDGNFKLTEFRVQNQRRLRFETSLRE